MAVIGHKITVTTGTPTALAKGTTGIVSDPVPVVVKNSPTNSASVFIGGATVTATAGYELETGQGVSLQLVTGENLFGVTAATSVSIDILIGRQNQ